MASSFIGKPISLISQSNVRYRGILAGIDPVQSTIQLSNVYSMGTESRLSPEQFIPPVQEPYAYIIFRASEVKDLAVDEPTPQRSVHDDPAVLGASAPAPAGSFNYPATGQPPTQPQQPTTQQQQPQPPFNQPPRAGPAPTTQPGPAAAQNRAAQPAPAAGAKQNGRSSAVNNATASMESVERALGDLRVADVPDNAAGASGNPPRGGGGRRGRAHDKGADFKIPASDFDFQGSNAKFDKAGLKSPKVEGETVENGGEVKEKEKDEEKSAYDPKTSFFDTLSSGAAAPVPEGGRGRGARRGAGGRNRREEEREKNVATFGEPGGIGLMGPGAYVGGWGGHNRRGGMGGRGRRGGGGGGNRG